MKLKFIRTEEENTRLILIFAGWGADYNIGIGISVPGWDVAVAYDFTELSLDTQFLSRYYTVYLFAWSLGVFAASRLLPADRITSAFAINGTTDPVDNEYGIPVAIYRGTYENLSTATLKKFRLRMAGNRALYEDMSAKLPDANTADIENLRGQLKNIEGCATESDKGNLPWVRAYIGGDDKIFPPENMRRAWERDPEVKIIESKRPHYWNIEEIVRSVISDTTKVSARFAKASASYDTHAIAQYSVAKRLAAKLEAAGPKISGKILEVGCGTGLFTREYAGYLKPAEATFVDITKCGPFGIAPIEKYVTEDAETWICKQSDKWDAIVSASAIQWFADIPRFISECSRHLNPGGILAVSTYLAGTMEELDSIRPTPLLYPDLEGLRKSMIRHFSKPVVNEDCIRIEFKSVREMLMHLKHTGVGGSAPSTGATIADMSHLQSLTYRPVYIIGVKE